MNRASVVAIGLGLTSLAFAQTEESPAQFDQLDINNDGQISIYEAEANVPLLEQFGQLDTNGDGQLSRAEHAAFNSE